MSSRKRAGSMNMKAFKKVARTIYRATKKPAVLNAMRLQKRRNYRSAGRVPPILLPESHYVDAYYGRYGAVNNQIIFAPASGTYVLDGNGPATAAADTNAGGLGVVGIATGAGYNQRLGRKLLIKYIACRFRIYHNIFQDAAFGVMPAGSQLSIRVMCFWDQAPQLALPTAAQIMNINPGHTQMTFAEDKNRNRFKRLYDVTKTIGFIATVPVGGVLPATATCDINGEALWSDTIKVNGVQIYDDSEQGGVAHVQTGGLVWLFLSGEGEGGSNAAQLDLSYRLRFDPL